MTNSSDSKDMGLISPEKDIPGFYEDMKQRGSSAKQDASDLASYLDFLEEIEAFRTKKAKTEFVETMFEL